MPLSTSAKKAMRQSAHKQAQNYRVRLKVKKAIDTVRKGSNESSDMSALYAAVDTAAKRGVIHTNKASRIKSRLNKLAKTRALAAPKVKTTKKTAK